MNESLNKEKMPDGEEKPEESNKPIPTDGGKGT